MMKLLIKLAIIGGLIYGAIYFTDYNKNTRFGYDIHTLILKPADAGLRLKMKKTGAEFWTMMGGKESKQFFSLSRSEK